MTDGKPRNQTGPGAEVSAADRARFEEAVLPHMDAAYNLARHLLRDAHEAQDAVQESMLRAFRHFGGFRGGDGRAWLLAIVRNGCMSLLRRRRTRGEYVEFDEQVHGTAADAPRRAPEDDVARVEAASSVRDALAQLPVEYRETLVLRELEGLSYKEIAEVTAAPIGTVMSRLARGRERLARALGDREAPAS